MHLSYLLDTLEMAQRLVSAGASHGLIDPYAIPHAFQNQSQTKPDPAFIFAHPESRLSIREGRRSFRRQIDVNQVHLIIGASERLHMSAIGVCTRVSRQAAVCRFCFLVSR